MLETERLLLRPLTGADFEAYAAMLADPDVAAHLGAGPVSRADAWRSLALALGHERLRGYTFQAVVDKATGRLLGRCGLWRPEGWPGLEVGWALARSAWGHGYATEAARAWRDWAFTTLGAEELVSVIHVDNARSVAVARRIGHTYWRDLEIRGQPCQLWGQRRSD